jgi:hypothetical protein
MKYNDKQPPNASEAPSRVQQHHHYYYTEQQPGYQFTYGLRISTRGLVLLAGLSIAALLILFAINSLGGGHSSSDNVNTTVTVMPPAPPAHNLITQPPAPPAPTPRQFNLRRKPADIKPK